MCIYLISACKYKSRIMIGYILKLAFNNMAVPNYVFIRP